jgi:hypothetical protein
VDNFVLDLEGHTWIALDRWVHLGIPLYSLGYTEFALVVIDNFAVVSQGHNLIRLRLHFVAELD